MNPTTSRLCGILPTPPLTIAVLTKPDGEEYVFACDAGREAELVQAACRYASNPDLSWTFYDSTQLARSVLKIADTKCGGK